MSSLEDSLRSLFSALGGGAVSDAPDAAPSTQKEPTPTLPSQVRTGRVIKPGKQLIPRPPKEHGEYYYVGHRFPCRSNAAIAALLKSGIPKFELERGKTFEVPLGFDARGHTHYADFVVRELVLDFHVTRLLVDHRNEKYGDFGSREMYELYRELRQALPEGISPKEFKAIVRTILLKDYETERRAMMENSELHPGREYLVVSTPEQLVHELTKRYPQTNLLAPERFCLAFREHCENVEIYRKDLHGS